MALLANSLQIVYKLRIFRITIPTRTFVPCSSMKHRILDAKSCYEAKWPRLKMATAKVQLTAQETKLRDLLLDVAKTVDESKELRGKLVLRFAGGWVRDKLLSIPSNDIDVAINATTGSVFTQRLQLYLTDEDRLKRHGLAAADIGRTYKTAANPEKSKHLETSSITIMNYDLDFVNLRRETYSDDSRNPQIEFGTPTEDALRRDATINSLFYNLHTDEVEDFTGGLKDLAAKRIRTPVDPKTTFLDDPLRVLRLVRFANRLDFDIDPECEACMKDHEVMCAFERKITRERVQTEVVKMLKGKNPRSALEHFDRLGLYHTIFTDALSEKAPTPDVSNWRDSYNCLEKLMTIPSLSQSFIHPCEDLAWLLAAYTPWSTVKELPTYVGKMKLTWGAEAARVALKLETKKVIMISVSLKHYQEISNLKNSIIQGEAHAKERDVVALLIRKWDLQGSWRLQVVFAILVEAMKSDEALTVRPSTEQEVKTYKLYDSLLSDWQVFLDHLNALDVMDAPSIRNIADGTALKKALGLAPGKWLAPALDVCMAWTLRNPGINDPSEAIQEVKRRRVELDIPEPMGTAE